MKILHYFLGFPPYRSGGMTKYALDLMRTQVHKGDEAIALWPGRITTVIRKTSIYRHKDVDRVTSYEIVNPLPVPLDEGIVDTDRYMRSCDIIVYQDFLSRIKPDIIHIHTLMGLHREFITAAGLLNIRTIFTTHDYFGICPKVTLYVAGGACMQDHNCLDCVECNKGALTLGKIHLMQSSVYRILKNTAIMQYVRKHHRKKFFAGDGKRKQYAPTGEGKKGKAAGYSRLRTYYMSMLADMDIIHFNSSVAEGVYLRYFKPVKSCVMAITHQGIGDNRRTNVWKPGEIIRITYLAPAKPYKGFNVLKSALDELWESGKRNFQLRLYGCVNQPSEYMVIQEEGYQNDELAHIFAETDIVAAPSVWYETFGFTVLEAVSYGVPVIISDHVGAKDIIGDGGIVVKAGSKVELKHVLDSLDMNIIGRLRQNILELPHIKTWAEFIEENNRLYLSLTSSSKSPASNEKR